MLAEQQYRVHAEFVAPGVQGASNTGVHGHAVLFCQGEADVVLEDVVDVHRHDVYLGWEEALVR